MVLMVTAVLVADTMRPLWDLLVTLTDGLLYYLNGVRGAASSVVAASTHQFGAPIGTMTDAQKAEYNQKMAEIDEQNAEAQQKLADLNRLIWG